MKEVKIILKNGEKVSFVDDNELSLLDFSNQLVKFFEVMNVVKITNTTNKISEQKVILLRPSEVVLTEVNEIDGERQNVNEEETEEVLRG